MRTIGLTSEDKFGWTHFYEKFADKLNEYSSSRGKLIHKLEKVYADTRIDMPKLDIEMPPRDIDPFTVFGLFNKGIKKENRILILKAIKREFGVDAEVPEEFDGIPVLNNLNATFYAFSNDKRRNAGDIDRLWALFAAALAYSRDTGEANRKAFVDAYDAVMHQFGLSFKLTMGIYWIRPYQFINLDSRNRWFLEERQTFSREVASLVKGMKNIPDGAGYLDFQELVKNTMTKSSDGFRSFPELSYEAWLVSEQVNEENKLKEKEKERQQQANALGDADVESTRYWLYSPGEGASMWDVFRDKGIMGLGWSGLGDLTQYASQEQVRKTLEQQSDEGIKPSNSAKAVWQFANDVKPGDVVFAKKGRSEIIGRGLVTSDYEYDSSLAHYPNIHHVEWTDSGHWHLDEKVAMKTLTDITDYQELVAKINAMFEGEEVDEIETVAISYPPYTPEDFLEEVYVDEQSYEKLANLLKCKKNVILQGAPGVGKTYLAKRLAYSIMGEKDTERVQMIQFHQSYSYEDFIMGYRPNGSGFELRRGTFYNFCKKAADDDRDYFFIIDEINRGNLSKIFGELFMLIEADKRGDKNKLQLLYSDELFYVPENVHIIGMMNTADRSLALLDYALRRRFSFFELPPAFESDGFKSYQESLGSERFDRLVQCVIALNSEISDDDSLGEGFQIGHSYLSNLSTEDIDAGRLSQIVEFDIVPLLKEYWFDEPETVAAWEQKMKDSIK